MRKFKHAGNGRIVMFSTDGNGNEIPKSRTVDFGPTDKPRTQGHGFYYNDYLKHIEGGGEVEPLETPEEIATREAKEEADAIESTKSLCIQYLNDSEKHVTNDPPYPANVQEWLDSRAVWRTILRSGEAQTVPYKPYGGE